VRHKGKTLKALMGRAQPMPGITSNSATGTMTSPPRWVSGRRVDQVHLAGGSETEGFVSAHAGKRTCMAPLDRLYKEKMLPLGTYRGELYDIGFDRPETHAIEKDGRLYYAFFADRWAARWNFGVCAPARTDPRLFQRTRLGHRVRRAMHAAGSFERFLAPRGHSGVRLHASH